MSQDIPWKGGVKEMVQSPEGRKRLAKLQEANRVDIAQPGSPLFEKAWGGKIKKDKEAHDKREREARDEWANNKERNEWVKNTKGNKVKIVVK